MNTCAFQGILLQKSLRYTQERRAITEFVIEISPLREGDPKENLKAIYWGENGEKAHNSLQTGDQLILQDQLRINKVTHKTGNEEYVEQQASVIVEKINRIQHAS
ncbi:single-stranded DNA-binding protein [Acaryochloris marina NIES-2412]|uniref:single-stranded DNA-binding protein n=1 Tax=Acaryochloris marina TaxID=155978 RepID=UPI00405A21A4